MKKQVKIVLIIMISTIGLFWLIYGIAAIFDDVSLMLLGDNPYYLEFKEEFTDPGYKLFNNKNKKVIIDSNIDSSILGIYFVKYKVNNKYYLREVRVVDKTPPVITLKGDDAVSVCPGKKYKEEGYTVTDNFDKFLDNKVKVLDKGDYIEYIVKDLFGNIGKKIRKIKFTDEESPVIKAGKVIHFLNQEYNDIYSASDNCDGDITNNVKVVGIVDTNKVGTYELNYEVTDKAGNISTSTRNVLVVDKDNYTGGIIYLTFDDGPSINNTPKILDILKTNNIKATFFINDHGTSLDYLVAREAKEGHSIGNHTASHNYKYIYSSDNTFLNDLEKVENKIISITGTSQKIMRFPGGSSNTVSMNYNKGIMSRLTRQVGQRGYKYYDWNVGSGDTDEKKTSDAICKSVTNNLGKGQNIVLMHDRKEMTATVDAVPCIIEYGLNNGYIFDKITNDTKSYHHYISN